MMSRILGLDYGRKRIGVALSDPLGISAHPKGFIQNGQSAYRELKAMIEENDVQDIVVGLPMKLSGNEDLMAEEVRGFARKLKKETQKNIIFQDERLTTAESEKLLISADIKRKIRKDLRDQMAAVLILQGYLRSLE